MNSKAWTSRWQETVGKTVNAAAQAAAENAARLRQAVAERTTVGEGTSNEASPVKEPEQKPTQMIRIPREAAAKLRWFDAADLGSLVEAHAQEKTALHDTITALKQALLAAKGEDESAMEQQLSEQLAAAERQHTLDEAVNGVLLMAARREIEAVQSRADRHEAEAERLRGVLTVRDAELATARASAEEAAAEAATARACAEEAAAEAATARASAEEAAAEAATLRVEVEAKGREIADLSQRLLHLEPVPCPGTPTFVPVRQPFRGVENGSEDGGHSQEAADEGAPAPEGTSDTAELPADGDLMPAYGDEGVHVRTSDDGRVELMRVRSNELCSEDGLVSADVSPNVLIPLQRAPEVTPLAGTPEGLRLHSSASEPATNGSQPATNGWASEDAKPAPEPSAETLRQELAAEHGAAEALLRKLKQVEEERLLQQEQVAALTSQVGSLEQALREAGQENATLVEKLAGSRAEMEELKASSQERLQELREHVARQSQRGKERLQQAQAIVMEVEERAAAEAQRAEEASARATRAEAELRDARTDVRRLTADVKAKEKERDRAESRAATAEAALSDARHRGASEAEKGGALHTALASHRKAAEEREASLRQQLRETETALRQRNSKLDQDNQDLRRQLARAEGEVDTLEKKVAELETTNGQLHFDLRAADVALADRDELAARAQALEERLHETRAQHNLLENYKQIAAEQEQEKVKVQEEMVSTVRIATALEARLQAANRARDAAEQATAGAVRRAQEAEERVTREVARRLDAIGADERQWPKAARDETQRLEKRLEAVNALLATLQSQLEEETQNHEAAAVAKTSLQVRLAAAEERAMRAEREGRDALAKLERALKQAQAETADWRREAAAAEAERDKLQAAQRVRVPLAGARSFPVRKGGGGLLGIAEEEKSNGGRERELLQGVDIVYLKNVLLKFLDAHVSGITEQCEVLLPAVATLLRASPEEFKAIKKSVHASPVHTLNKVTRGWL